MKLLRGILKISHKRDHLCAHSHGHCLYMCPCGETKWVTSQASNICSASFSPGFEKTHTKSHTLEEHVRELFTPFSCDTGRLQQLWTDRSANHSTQPDLHLRANSQLGFRPALHRTQNGLDFFCCYGHFSSWTPGLFSESTFKSKNNFSSEVDAFTFLKAFISHCCKCPD